MELSEIIRQGQQHQLPDGSGRPFQFIVVDSAGQKLLQLDHEGRELAQFRVSTSAEGLGGETGSYRTPPGWHRVVERYGLGQPEGSVFASRRLTGALADPQLADDQITSRILRLHGLEPGLNAGPGCDSYGRYIYIHGTNHEGELGKPASRGCIRMANRDLVRLFKDSLHAELLVYIY